jgi:hypothetical protein
LRPPLLQNTVPTSDVKFLTMSNMFECLARCYVMVAAHGAVLGKACFRLFKSMQWCAGFPFRSSTLGVVLHPRGALLAFPCQCEAMLRSPYSGKAHGNPRMIVFEAAYRSTPRPTSAAGYVGVVMLACSDVTRSMVNM